MKAKVNKVMIQIIQDDLFSLDAAAAVNATDPNLSLPDSILVRAGDNVLRECREIGWCAVGSAVITSAGGLPFQKLIHAVGPRWGEGSERGKLANTTLHCLKLAEAAQLRSVALPAISTGAMGYPIENCAKTMLTQIIDFTFEDLRYLRAIIVCLDNPTAYDVFCDEFARQIDELKKSGDGRVKV